MRPACSLFLFLALGLAPAASAQCDRLRACELVWADEFDGTAVDTSKWEFMLGDGTSVGLPAGWGNNELEYYQEANATVADGVLTITARRESVAGYDFTSARLRTLAKGDWTYGRMEMRAKMPIGQGLWPAFWMLPSDSSIYGGWAASGEIDIVEYLGSEPDRVFGTIHYGSPWPNNVFSSSEYVLQRGTFDENFHIFAIEWERGEIRWYVDEVHYGTKTEWFSTGGPFPAPFDVDFHLLLNLAVGGNLPGPPDATTSFPQELVVDWVRVYQPAAVKGSQSSTSDLQLERRVKMKKVETALTLPFSNQARKRDRPNDPRRLSCSVTARGTRGALKVNGTLDLELLGSVGAARWSSAALRATVDADGSASFSAEDIARLVTDANAAGATVEMIRVTFSGGRGKKVTALTLDCVQLAG